MCSAVVANPERARFSKEIARLNMRPLLMHSCEIITAKQAERRVLMLENPALPGSTFITTTLYAGLQAILPGEIARTHRHTPNALRFIMEGEGAYTAIDGERVTMGPGDFVVTPGWTWHDHGNLGGKPVVWLDGLDTAFANLFGAHFREDHPDESQATSRPEGDSSARYGANLLPVDRKPQGQCSPVLSYPYERTRAALEQLSKDGEPHPAHGWKLRYANPGTGGHAFPTMAAFMQWLPKGFAGRRHRSTDGAVFCVVEGRGSATIGETRGETRFDFAPNDVFVVPSWETHRFEAESDCVIFSYSDRAAQEALGLWREIGDPT